MMNKYFDFTFSPSSEHTVFYPLHVESSVRDRKPVGSDDALSLFTHKMYKFLYETVIFSVVNNAKIL